MPKVEFVEYTGCYPNRCSGRLFVKVNGKMISFGDYCLEEKGKTDDTDVPNYPQFWKSGGWVEFDEDWNEDVGEGPWELNYFFADKYSDDILELIPELLRIFNENVPWGCCGGCI